MIIVQIKVFNIINNLFFTKNDIILTIIIFLIIIKIIVVNFLKYYIMKKL